MRPSRGPTYTFSNKEGVGVTNNDSDIAICSGHDTNRTREEEEANADLINDAFNTYFETRLKPSQLVGIIRELTLALKEVSPLGGSECFRCTDAFFCYADPDYMKKCIQELRKNLHETKVNSIRLEKRMKEIFDNILPKIKHSAFDADALRLLNEVSLEVRHGR